MVLPSAGVISITWASPDLRPRRVDIPSFLL
jgi:hypothetical protein